MFSSADMSGDESVRAFLAIDVPGEIKKALKKIQSDLKGELSGVKWVREEAIHLTLKFLGNVRGSQLENLSELLAPPCIKTVPLYLSLGGLGAFPTAKRPRVLWVGLEGDIDALAGLQSQIDECCLSLGFERERRRFSPHLTMGRVKGRKIKYDKLPELIKDVKIPHRHSFRVAKVCLYKSDLRPQGAFYTKIKTFPLAGE